MTIYELYHINIEIQTITTLIHQSLCEDANGFTDWMLTDRKWCIDYQLFQTNNKNTIQRIAKQGWKWNSNWCFVNITAPAQPDFWLNQDWLKVPSVLLYRDFACAWAILQCEVHLVQPCAGAGSVPCWRTVRSAHTSQTSWTLRSNVCECAFNGFNSSPPQGFFLMCNGPNIYLYQVHK